jgi:hypothetical protein
MRHYYFATGLVVVLCCLALDSPIVRSDGLGYYMWLNSIAVDRDFDLSNQVAKYHPTFQAFLSPVTGRYASGLAFGTAFLWLPFYEIALQIEPFVPPNAIDDRYLAFQGEHFIRTFAVMVGTNVCGLMAALLAGLSARRVTSGRAALLAAIAIFLGTPLLYYATIESSMSQAASAFAMTLIIWRFVTQQRGSTLSWLILGGLTGLAGLIRWQNLAVAVPLAVLCLAEGSAGWWKRLRSLAAFGLGVIILAWPIPYNSYVTMGSPFTAAVAAQYPWPYFVGPIYVREVLFSNLRGLFVWSPILLLSVLGLLVVWRRDGKLAWLLSSLLVLQVLINSSTFNWDGGWSFGSRRMADFYPAYVIGFACLADLLNSNSRHFARLWRAVFWSLSAAMVIFSLYLMVMLAASMIDPAVGTASDAVAYLGHNPSVRVLISTMTRRYGIWAWATPRW